MSSLRVLVGVKMRNLVEKFGWNLVEIWFKIRLKHSWLPFWQKVLFWLNLVVAVLIIWLIWLGFGQNSVGNCWDNFDTEREAILACEK